MSRWSPVGLPKARRQIGDWYADPECPQRTGLSEDVCEEITSFAHQMHAAELYWATEDMSALAVSAGSSLPDIDLTERPNPVGLIVFDGGVGDIDHGDDGLWSIPEVGNDGVVLSPNQLAQVTPVDAVLWGPGPQGSVRIWAFTHRRIMETSAQAAGLQLTAWLPPLMAMLGDHIMPIGGNPREHRPGTQLPAELLRTLAAAWHIMQQPTLTDRSTLHPDRSTVRALQRAGAGHEVTLIDLRRAYIPDQYAETGDGEGRVYKHRWVVSGHWRDQAHGPNRSLRRRQWIAAHVKGPDGAPLLATERVNVWRR